MNNNKNNIENKIYWVLESERLIFRRLAEEDLQELAQMLTDPRVMYAWEHTFTDEQINDWIQKQLTSYSKHNVGYFAAIEKETSEFVGQMGLHWSVLEDKEILEVCYMLNYEHWKKGFAIEGVQALVSYAHSTLKVNDIYAFIKYNNISSCVVAEQAGFLKKGSFIKKYNGKDMEHFIYYKELHNSTP